MPTRLVGTAGIDGPIPARLGAFFRDRDELTASGDLGATIRAALADPAALIVVCSPAAAALRLVGAEIHYFRDSGRGDRILVLLVKTLALAGHALASLPVWRGSDSAA